MGWPVTSPSGRKRMLRPLAVPFGAGSTAIGTPTKSPMRTGVLVSWMPRSMRTENGAPPNAL